MVISLHDYIIDNNIMSMGQHLVILYSSIKAIISTYVGDIKERDLFTVPVLLTYMLVFLAQA